MGRQLATRVALLTVLLCAAVGGFVWLYRHSADIDAARHDRILALTEQVRQVDANWSADVLRSATDVNRDYDALITPLVEWPRLRALLTSEIRTLGNSSTDAILNKIDSEFESKAALVNRFKSKNAILKNSLRYLPTAQSELGEVIAGERSRATDTNRTAMYLLGKVDTALRSFTEKDSAATLRTTLIDVRNGLQSATRGTGAVQAAIAMSATDATIGSLVANAMRFNLTPENVLATSLRAHNDEVRGGASNLAPSLRPGVLALTNHVSIVLRERQEVSDLLTGINNVPIPASVDRLVGAVNEGFSTHIAQQAKYTRWFQLYVVALLVCLGIGAYLLLRHWMRLSQVAESSQAQLKTAQLRLLQQDRLAELGKVSASMAHEINSPLAAASSAFAMLKEMYEKNVLPLVHSKQSLQSQANTDGTNSFPEHVQQDFEESLTDGQSAVTQIRDVIENLRDFARVDHGRISQVHLERQVESTLRMLTSDINGNGIEVIRQYGETPPVSCNAGAINQVVLNIVRNAAEAMPNGGKLTVETKMVGTDYVAITVVDTGEGMSDETRSRIFDTGFTSKADGQGIGLSLSQDIVKQHGGHIRVWSEPGKGSAFAVVLPIRMAATTNDTHGSSEQ